MFDICFCDENYEKVLKSQRTKFVRSSNMTVSCIKRKYALWILRSSDE